MTTIKDAINKCDTMVDFNNLLKDIQPKIGKMGGRRFVEGASGHRGLTGDVALKDIAKKFYELMKDSSTTNPTIERAKKFIATLNEQGNIDLSKEKSLKGTVLKFLTALRRFFGGKFDVKEFKENFFSNAPRVIITASDSTDLKSEMKILNKDEIKNIKSNMPKSYKILLKLANENDKNKQDKLKLEFFFEYSMERLKLKLAGKQNETIALSSLLSKLTFFNQVLEASRDKEFLQEQEEPLEELIESLTETQKDALIACDSKDLEADMEKIKQEHLDNFKSILPRSYEILVNLAGEDDKNNQDKLKLELFVQFAIELKKHEIDLNPLNLKTLNVLFREISFFESIRQAHLIFDEEEDVFPKEAVKAALVIACVSKDLKEDMGKLNEDEIKNFQSLAPDSYDILLKLADEDDKNNQDKLKVKFYNEVVKEMGAYSEDFKKINKDSFDFFDNTILKITFTMEINQVFIYY